MASVAEGCGGVRTVSQKAAASGARFRSGDTLVARITPCLENGKIARVPDLGPHGSIGFGSTEFIVLRGDGVRTDSGFLSHVARWRPFRDHAEANLIGSSGRQRVSASVLGQFAFALPPLPEQQRIAGVLGAFDDLIETNRRLADDCLRLARLAAATALADQDWSSNLPDYVTVAKGFSYRSSELQATGGQHLLNLKNAGRGGAFRFDGYKRLETARHKRIQEVDDGDIVVSLTDLTQARDIIARAFRVERRGLRGTIVASLDLAVVRPKAGVSREFVWAVLMDPKFRAHAVPYCNGTTVLHMKDAALNDFSIPEPAESLMRRIDHEVRPLLEASTLCQTEADHLASQRDELLPLLMSGKVRVSEVEGSLP